MFTGKENICLYNFKMHEQNIKVKLIKDKQDESEILGGVL